MTDENSPAQPPSADPSTSPAGRTRRPRSPRKKRAATNQFSDQMTLKELRVALGLTQVQLAQKLDRGQNVICDFELNDSHNTSTLRDYLGALGLQMEIVVRVAGHEVRLKGV